MRKSINARSEGSRENILAASRILFARRGYDGTSLDEIARAAGFTKGAVYYFFHSKEALFLSLLDQIEARSIGHTAAALAEANGTVGQQLTLFIRLQAEWAGANPEDLAILIRASIDAVGDDASGVSKRVKAIYDRIEATLEEALRRGGEGALPEAGIADAVVSLLALHDGNMLLWYRGGCDPAVGRRLVSATRHAMLFTIGLAR